MDSKFIPNLSNTMTSGFYWDKKTIERINNEIYLEQFGFKVYSQNDEDGIIEEIFNRISITNKRFIEFGVQHGLECNSHYLLHKGWSGLWIDGDKKSYEEILYNFSPVIQNKQLVVHNEFITRDNINAIFKSSGFSGEIDLLSIDIDGNDYHIFETLEDINPRVIIIEYNAKFPPKVEWIMPYDPSYIWKGDDKQGASLASLTKLANEKGYQLVGTNAIGVNAFFVRKDLCLNLFPIPATADNLYNPARFNHGLSYRTGHHPSTQYLEGDITNNITKKRNKLFRFIKLITGIITEMHF